MFSAFVHTNSPFSPHSQVISLYEEISKSFVELVDGGANPPSASGGGPAAAAAVRGGDAPSSSPSAPVAG